MSKTPSKTDTTSQFRDREIHTPNKNQHEITKTVYSNVSRVHTLFSDWLNAKDKGVRVLKSVTSTKLHECENSYYPSQLRPLMLTLLEVLEKLKGIVDEFILISQRLQALAQLQPSNEPAIFTWPISKISNCVKEIVESVEKEYKLHEVITENVAHCRDERLIEVYVTSWEHDVYLNTEGFAFLCAEFGLTGIERHPPFPQTSAAGKLPKRLFSNFI